MEEQSYYLQHLELAKQFEEIEDEIEGMIAKIAKLEIESIQEKQRKFIKNRFIL